LAQNEQRLRDLIKANGTADIDVEETIEAYKAYLASASPGSKLDDRNARAILDPILRDIEDLCREQKIPIRNGVVYGVAPVFELLARQREVMETDVSIIDVSMPFLVFCNCASKALARTLPHEAGPLIKVSNDPAVVLPNLRASRKLLGEWQLIILHFAYGELPPHFLSPPPDQVGQQVIRILLLRAMEWFALAHEYGHHVMKHGQVTSTAETRSVFDDEHEADLFARAVSITLGDKAEPPNIYALSGVGGVIVLGLMDMIRRARWVLETGLDSAPAGTSHPPLADRVNVFGLLDQHLPEQLRASAKEMRECFLKIIEGIWEDVLPVLQQAHKEGVRPDTSGSTLV
jgi:hypothetical protein